MDKIVCIGKNYREHAKELGDAVPEKPVLFLKPPSVLGIANNRLEAKLPTGVGSIHHECEIVLKLSRGGYRMTEAEAAHAIEAVTLGLDMTLRDRQAVLKKNGHPWTTAKVFPDSAIAGPWRPLSGLRATPFTFHLDGQCRQTGVASDMSFSPEQCIAYASEFFPLCPGDLLFTGTPAGVGEVKPGQTAILKWGEIEYSVVWNT